MFDLRLYSRVFKEFIRFTDQNLWTDSRVCGKSIGKRHFSVGNETVCGSRRQLVKRYWKNSKVLDNNQAAQYSWNTNLSSRFYFTKFWQGKVYIFQKIKRYEVAAKAKQSWWYSIQFIKYFTINAILSKPRKSCEMCSKLTIKIFRAFIVNFEHISHLFLVFLFSRLWTGNCLLSPRYHPKNQFTHYILDITI